MTISVKKQIFDFTKSSEPKYIKVLNGSDHDWRPVSMFEIQELEYAINESEPGHLKELHDAGNEIIHRLRKRPNLAAYQPTSSGEQILGEFIEWCNQFDDYTCNPLFTPSFVLKKIQSLIRNGDV